ncbi:zinc-binding alcohol dehydrogenase family protein [Nonomuraea sp. NPDC050556]|uniref:zinc-binding alcohol dehydrogenase family protein n=1 Tax=Nonomuraea sp. NPDC050556 TaxID=3364369 RepID=UPI003794E10C
MRAIMVHEHGGPEVLTLTDLPEPEAGPGQVVVRAEAIGVSVVEAHMRAGILPIPLPAVLGVEAAGQVVAVGEGVDPALVGTAVAGVTGGAGAYAEFAAMPVAMTAPIPAGVSAVDAVAAGAAGAVALGLIHKAALRGGETVLVEAGASNVGGYLLQLAREFGAGRILATAGAEGKRELARSLGADVVIDHRQDGWTAELGDAIDVAFESIGGASARGVIEALTPGTGRMLYYGRLSGEAPAITPDDLLGRGATLVGCSGPAWFAEVFTVRYPEVFARLADGRTKAAVGLTLPLADAAEAHRLVESRGVTGKIVLIP